MAEILGGLASALTLTGLVAMVAGLAWGTVGGALPGVSGPQAMALLLPLTFGMDTATALLLLAGVWTGANYGGSIPAILIRSPGTASSAAVILDGYQLVRQGKAGKALGVSLVCGSIGGLISVVMLAVLLGPLERVVLSFGSPEIFALTLFALTVISSLTGPSVTKGIASALFGLFLATVGLDQIAGMPRFTFGRPELLSGFSLVAVIIGLFAVSEMLRLVAEPPVRPTAVDRRVNTELPTLRELLGLWRATAIGSVVGMIVGAAGAGGPVSSFVAYGEAKRWSKRPELFGNGSMEGVAAPETANNSDQGSALVPALALGVPGSPSAAIILAALILHGIQPGPALLQRNTDLLFTFFAALILVQFLMLPVGMLILRLCIELVSVRPPILATAVLVLSMVGTYALNLSVADAAIALLFGVVGYAMRSLGFSPAAAVLGLVLGFIMEGELRRSMLISFGDPAVFLARPITLTLLVLAALVLLRPLLARALAALRPVSPARGPGGRP
ncbi:MAG TPA: tripartite tricarboxylate transporter permease [Candidatus Limnocylindrales bacterium]|nr:tripartite tricarboxylate transporter permease [Candidatus Limnocylindrales bacterium]